MQINGPTGLFNIPSLAPTQAPAVAEPLMGPASSTPGTSGPSQFGDALKTAISGVNDAQLKAMDTSARFAAGEPMDVHQVMISAQEASIALSMAVQVRNKVTESYQELMHMAV